MTSILFLAIALLTIGSPAHASVSPELDATSLTAIVSGITGLVVTYRMVQRKNAK